jgi:hypothetical protein
MAHDVGTVTGSSKTTLYTEGFSHFANSMTDPIASGWSIIAGWNTLRNAAFARRTPEHDIHIFHANGRFFTEIRH